MGRVGYLFFCCSSLHSTIYQINGIVGLGGIGAASDTSSSASYDIGGIDGGILKSEIVASSTTAGANYGVVLEEPLEQVLGAIPNSQPRDCWWDNIDDSHIQDNP